MSRFQTFITFVLLLWIGAAPVQADPAGINALVEQGKLDEALASADQELAADADNVTLRFLRGLILTRMNRLDEAAAAFQELTEAHPELPEPYNNLAVVYAAKGDFERARQSLQQAINTHPSYATAHENMGDIYAKMASQAYNQALELNEDNPTAKAKLSLINNLFSLPAAATPTQVAEAPAPKPAKTASSAPPPAAAPAEERPPQTPPEPAPQAKAEAPPAAPETVAVVPAAAADTAASEEVRRAVDLWATAWSSKDFSAYAGMYAPEFAPPDGESRAAWERSRRDRIARPAFIKIDVSDLRITMLAPGHAQAAFTQGYQSDTFSDSVKKMLILKKSEDRWLITEEASR